MKQTILVAGLGLIGGSLAKSLGTASDNYIMGYDVQQETMDYAYEHHIIDAQASFREAAKRADIIILAAPISKTIDLIKQLDTIDFEKNVIVTDVASVKGSIVDAAKKLTNEKITFIGGHPMAGSHKSGIQAAKGHLFENAIYVLTPMDNCSSEKLHILQGVLEQTKCRFVVLDAQEHDEMTCVVSHFPHLIASSLVHQAKKWEDTHAYLPELAAGGFRDITRIASSNPDMWQDIFYHNRNKMVHLLEEWIAEMIALKDTLKHSDKKRMINFLEQARDYRDGLDRTKKGAIPSFYDLYVDIKDQTGALAAVVQMLAAKSISITNIRILEIRNDIYGALRLSFGTKAAQTESYHLLQANNYEVMMENGSNE